MLSLHYHNLVGKTVEQLGKNILWPIIIFQIKH